MLRHPVLSLATDIALVVTCHDPIKADLLNTIKADVICDALQAEVRKFIAEVYETDLAPSKFDIEKKVIRLREKLYRRQCANLQSFPPETHSVVRRIIDQHAASLASVADLFVLNYTLHEIMEMVLNLFHMATFTTLCQLTQTANQLDGHLNGLRWKGQLLEYSYRGTITDASRILGSAVQLLQDLIGHDMFVCLSDSHGKIEMVSRGTQEMLGFEPSSLVGLPLSVLQLGVPCESEQANLRELEKHLKPFSIDTNYRHCTGEVLDVRVQSCSILFSDLLQYYRLTVAVRRNGHGAFIEEDLHTRAAFLLSLLTHPERRAIAGGPWVEREKDEVTAILDGAPDLPFFHTMEGLHSLMDVPLRRIQDTLSRCDRRIHNDLLKSATLCYEWKTTVIEVEFFVMGGAGNIFVSIHRPAPTSDPLIKFPSPTLPTTIHQRPRKPSRCFPRRASKQ